VKRLASSSSIRFSPSLQGEVRRKIRSGHVAYWVNVSLGFMQPDYAGLGGRFRSLIPIERDRPLVEDREGSLGS
jgi:hypothetical protein